MSSGAKARRTGSVYVGQGDVSDRLAAHRQDEKILACRKYGRLQVTWAFVPVLKRDGVERFLPRLTSHSLALAFLPSGQSKVNLPVEVINTLQEAASS